MNLLIILGFPDFVALIVIICVYSKQMYCGTEEWN